MHERVRLCCLRTLESGALRLSNLHPSDEGEYECRAENRMGSTEARVRVIVQERPVLTVTPETRVQVRQVMICNDIEAVRIFVMFCKFM